MPPKRVRRSNKKSYKKKGPSNKQLATRVKKLEHATELKYRDYSTSVTWASPGISFLPCVMDQGDDFNQRVGEEINAKFANFKFFVRHAIGANPDSYRIIVFWDMQTNGVGFTPLTSISPSLGLLDDSVIANPLLAPHNYRCSDRYTILHDKVRHINPQSTNTVWEKIINKNIKLSGARIKYSGSGGTVADLTSRALSVYCYSNTTLSLSQISVRFWYTDA